MTGRAGENVQGYLFWIVERLERFRTTSGRDFNTGSFENVPDDVKDALDAIDLAIVNLLGEDATEDEVDAVIGELAEQTFAFAQSNEAQKLALKRLFQVRGEDIQLLLRNGGYPLLKKLSITPQLFRNIKDVINTDDLRWLSIREIQAPETLQMLKETLGGLDHWRHTIELFRGKRRWFNEDILWNIVSHWISGKSLPEIANLVELPEVGTDQVLEILSKLVDYELRTLVSAVIDAAQAMFEENDLVLSPAIASWPAAVAFGVPTITHVNLINLGFKERIVKISTCCDPNTSDLLYVVGLCITTVCPHASRNIAARSARNFSSKASWLKDPSKRSASTATRLRP